MLTKMTLREIVYMILDELKLMSDDSSFNEEHIKFLVNKYRVALLKQKHNNNFTMPISSSNYQTIKFTILNKVNENNYVKEKEYFKSNTPVPTLLSFSNTIISADDVYGNYLISLIPKERMPFVGFNKWLKNSIYATIDNYLYLYSPNTDIEFKDVYIQGIFEDPEKAHSLSVDSALNFMDIEYPIEHDLVPVLIQSVVQELYPKTIIPEDSENNASDDKANLTAYIQRNSKSALSKAL